MNNGAVRLYVGNLPYEIRSGDLKRLFSSFGQVLDAVVMMEPGNGDRSKGFGFVSMATVRDANIASVEMNGKELLGRVLVCNIAKARSIRPDGRI